MGFIFRGKNTKDMETARETVIDSTNFMGRTSRSNVHSSKLSVTGQQAAEDNFDNFIEKRN